MSFNIRFQKDSYQGALYQESVVSLVPGECYVKPQLLEKVLEAGPVLVREITKAPRQRYEGAFLICGGLSNCWDSHLVILFFALYAIHSI